VLLHPLPLDGSIWPAELWELADEVFAPTLYSVGRSLSAWGADVVEAMPVGACLLVGNSVGGSCALEVANLASERVAGLVLIGAKAGVRPDPAFRDEAVRVLRDEGIGAAWDRYWAPLFAPDADVAVVERAKAIASGLPLEHVVNGVHAFHTRSDRAGLLAALDVPVTIVRGEHDGIPNDPQLLASSLRRGTFVEVARAGHYVPVERPDALVSIVRDAITR
jgi:pimeloyl-ACP methyl ester carboxylesterase